MSDEFEYNASTVTSYFVLNSRQNIHISRGFKVVLYLVAARNGNGNEWEWE